MSSSTILECRSAEAGDRSRFIDAEDIGRWFAKMTIEDIKDFMEIFRHRELLNIVFKKDWKNIINEICQPSVKEIKNLQTWWKRTDAGDNAFRERYGYQLEPHKPSECRQLWFNIADSGEIAKREREKKVSTTEDKLYYDIIVNDKHYSILKAGSYDIEYKYFKRMADVLSTIRHIIMCHFGWTRRRGIVLNKFGDYGEGDMIKLFYGENVAWLRGRKISYMKAWENVFFKVREGKLISEYCEKALMNPHTDIGRKHGEALYDECFINANIIDPC